MSLPPDRNASVNDTGSELTPGSRSSGKMTCSRERLCASSRASSSSSTVAASDAALPSPPCVSVHDGPPTGEHDRWIARCGIVSFGVPCGNQLVATVVAWVRRAPQVFGPDADDRAALVRHFRERGWVVVDAVGPATAAAMPAAGSTRSRRSPTASAVCCSTSSSPTRARSCVAARTSCRSTPGLRDAAVHGSVVEVAGALLGEPAVLYKEKINHKLPGGAGYSPHQDAPAYPMIDVHVSAMVAVDDADEIQRWPRGGLGLLRRGAARSTSAGASRLGRRAARLAAGAGARRAHAVVPQPHTAPQRPEPLGSAPPGALPHLQRRP